jgi:hypothetical protein
VPGTGIEPAHSCERQILSLLRLPIPPPGQFFTCKEVLKGCNVTTFYSIESNLSLLFNLIICNSFF